MRRKTIIIAGISGLCLLGLGAGLLVPRMLVQQVTRIPTETETGTFVTRQQEVVDLNQKLQDALLTAGVALPPAEAGHTQSEATTDFDAQALPQSAEPDSQYKEPPHSQDEVIWRSPSRASHSEHRTQPDTVLESSSDNRPGEAIQTEAQTYQTAPVPTAPVRQQPYQKPPQPVPQAQDFEVSMSEAEISNLVYTQLQRGIDPRYQAALQGVSTRIQQGKARITVALLPKHLPDAFLKNLPGVTPDTPTVYLGGEMSLSQQGNRVVPDIHHISLGNFKIPLPFIQSAVRSQVEAYSQQMLRLPDGRQAELYSVSLEQGALTLTGVVD